MTFISYCKEYENMSTTEAINYFHRLKGYSLRQGIKKVMEDHDVLPLFIESFLETDPYKSIQ